MRAQVFRQPDKQEVAGQEAFGPDGKSLTVVFETAAPFETRGWKAAGMTELSTA
jgi:hypothetical protein